MKRKKITQANHGSEEAVCTLTDVHLVSELNFEDMICEFAMVKSTTTKVKPALVECNLCNCCNLAASHDLKKLQKECNDTSVLLSGLLICFDGLLL